MGTYSKLLRAQWDRATAVVALLIGLLALLLGYVGISGEAFVARQLPFIISGGLFGIFMLGVAAVSWITAAMRDEWRELRLIRTLLEADLVEAGRSRTLEALAAAESRPKQSLDA